MKLTRHIVALYSGIYIETKLWALQKVLGHLLFFLLMVHIPKLVVLYQKTKINQRNDKNPRKPKFSTLHFRNYLWTFRNFPSVRLSSCARAKGVASNFMNVPQTRDVEFSHGQLLQKTKVVTPGCDSYDLTVFIISTGLQQCFYLVIFLCTVYIAAGHIYPHNLLQSYNPYGVFSL